MIGQASLFPKTGETLPQSLDIIIISNSEADKIVIKHHYLHRKRTGGLQLSHGVLFNGILLGVLVWASPTFHHKKGLIPPYNQKEVVELARFWLSDQIPYNGETATLRKAIKRLTADWEAYCGFIPKVIVSFSDKEISHEGTIYKAANFENWGFAKSARFADAGKGYSRNRERWKGRYSGKGSEVAPRTASTKKMWVYWLEKTQVKSEG